MSTAALDTSQVKGNEDIQVLLTSDNNVFLLCTLNKDRILQCPLDLNFAEGDKISFSIKGDGSVHLTGFLIPEAEDLEDFEDLEEEETAAAAQPIKAKKLQKQKEDGSNKKQAKQVAGAQEEAEDSDSSDDEDFNLEDAQADSGEEAADSDAEEGDDSDAEEGGEEEEDDDSEDDDSEDDDAQQPSKKPKLEGKAKQNGLENGQASAKEKKKDGAAKVLPGGVQITDLKVGSGVEAKPGKKVQVYYEGRLKQTNKIFDSSKQGSGFKFGLGRGEVIKGWDIGVVGMKVGGKRRIVCPPNVAYGQKGSPPVIPPNSTLVFDVELKNVH